MRDESSRRCIFLPVSKAEIWALPSNCLAEIVTVAAPSDRPPQEITWRGQEVLVLDFDDAGTAPWREARGQTGLVAVFLGLEGRGCDYWGVALRGPGLAMRAIPEASLEDRPEMALPRSLAAFRWSGVDYQIPDLQVLQEQVAMSGRA